MCTILIVNKRDTSTVECWKQKQQIIVSLVQRWQEYLVYKYKYIGLPLAMQMKLNKIHESWLS